MDPDSVKSTLSNLAFGNVMAAAARDYQKVCVCVLLFNSLCNFFFNIFLHQIQICSVIIVFVFVLCWGFFSFFLFDKFISTG